MTTEEPLLLNLDFEEVETKIAQKNNLTNLKQELETADLIKNDLDDKNSIISLSSSSTTEEICLVPEVIFEGINLDPESSAESQPLLGGGGSRDCIEQYESNIFPGKSFFWLFICHSLNFIICVVGIEKINIFSIGKRN